MEFRDITNEATLLFSYKRVYVDDQATQLLRAYRVNRTFPIFTEHVYEQSAKTPEGLIAYRTRSAMEDKDVGRMFVFERTDNTKDASVTRLFWVWLSPALVKRFADDRSNAPTLRANVVFHPFAGLDKYPAYWRGDIEPVKTPNYLELGVRYLFKEKFSVQQHFCALRAAGVKSGSQKLQGGPCPSAFAIVVPVSSVGAYMNLSDPSVLSEVLRQIGRRCYESITKRAPPPVSAVKLERIAVSTYSRSGAILTNLLANARKDPGFMTASLREIYVFDVMLDERKDGKVVKSKKQGYDELWAKLKAWQGDEKDRRIRLYSAEPATVSSVYQELKDGLRTHGGGYHAPSVKLSGFNGATRTDGKSKYAGLSDGYEIYSTDNARSLVVLPNTNPVMYLSSHDHKSDIKNDAGFEPGSPYEPGLEGHSWFVSRLQSHALFHSGF